MHLVPDLDALRLLLAIGRHGSISAGARQVGISQQAASARVRAVERLIGVQVFLRAPGGAAVTPVGETFLVWADAVVEAAERLQEGVELLRAEARQRLTVAASQTVSAHLVPAWLVALRRDQLAAEQEPTRVHLLTENSTTVADLVRTGVADLGFVESSQPPTDLSTVVVARDALVLVVPPEHPWAALASVDLGAVAATPLVSRELGSGTRDTWEAAVRDRLGVDPVPPVLELNSTAAIRSAVGRGEAAAVLSALVVTDDVELGRLVVVPIDGAPIQRPITALWRGTARDLSPVGRQLIETATRNGPFEPKR